MSNTIDLDKVIELIPAVNLTEADLKVFPTLSLTHQIFVEYYALYPNGAKAYQKAYPNSSPDSTGTNAYRLLGEPKIKDAINEIQSLNRQRFGSIGKEFVISELLKLIDSKNQNTKLRALDLLSKILGIHQQKVSVDGIEPITVVLAP